MKSKPDDRRDNVKNIQNNIDHTIRNMEIADEIIAQAADHKSKEELREKNKRRGDALDGMRREIKDEAKWQEKGKSN